MMNEAGTAGNRPACKQSQRAYHEEHNKPHKDERGAQFFVVLLGGLLVVFLMVVHIVEPGSTTPRVDGRSCSRLHEGLETLRRREAELAYRAAAYTASHFCSPTSPRVMTVLAGVWGQPHTRALDGGIRVT